jgi:hypothetical protein
MEANRGRKAHAQTNSEAGSSRCGGCHCTVTSLAMRSLSSQFSSITINLPICGVCWSLDVSNGSCSTGSSNQYDLKIALWSDLHWPCIHNVTG